MKTFQVAGRGEFPMDMLRYDECDFLTHTDRVCALQEHQLDPLRVLRLQGLKDPTVARWESFGWHVRTEGWHQDPPIKKVCVEYTKSNAPEIDGVSLPYLVIIKVAGKADQRAYFTSPDHANTFDTIMAIKARGK